MSKNVIKNVAIVAHGGAGKTSLVEAILYNAKVVNRLGRVDNGSSFTDFDPEEIKRKISVNSSLVNLNWNKSKINIIDTPGYADFIGEMIRSLRVVESALIVIDASSGVEVGTEVAWKYAEEENISKIIFINKLDKENIDFYAKVNQIQKCFGSQATLFQMPIGEGVNFKGVVDLIEMKALIYQDGKVIQEEIPKELNDKTSEYREKLIEKIAETNDELTEEYLEGKKFTPEEIYNGIKLGVVSGNITPVLCGSALNDIAVPKLLDFLSDFVPSSEERKSIKGINPLTKQEEERKATTEDSFSAFVFKIETDPHIGELTYFRVFSGALNSSSEIYNITKTSKEKVGHICFINGKNREDISKVEAGDIAALVKLKNTSIFDTLCDSHKPIVFDKVNLPKPVISMSVHPKTKADQEKMGTGLIKLSEEDPTFALKHNHELKQSMIFGMGELHLEVMLSKLKTKFGVEIDLSKPKIAYRETIQGKAKAEGKYKKQSGGRGQYGHAFLEIEPLYGEESFEFVNNIFGGAIPAKYIPAVEKGVKDAMAKGILANYPIINIKATLYDGSFHNVDSSDLAFQIAGSFAFKKAFDQAKPVLLEPIMKVNVYVPEEYMGDIISDLNSRRGKIQGMDSEGRLQVVTALVPEAEMYKYSTTLRSVTQGRGMHAMEFVHYEVVPLHLAEQIIEEAKKEE
ncbi:MAG: elongation factor G [bacterium]|nr:elongation factor G [bacterium]